MTSSEGCLGRERRCLLCPTAQSLLRSTGQVTGSRGQLAAEPQSVLMREGATVRQESREGRRTLGGLGARLLALLTAGHLVLDTALGLSGRCSSSGCSLGIR